MQINQSNLTDLYRGYRVLFDDALQGTIPISDDIVLRVPSGNNEEKYVWLGAIPGMRQLVDEIQIKNLAASDWTIENLEFEDTVAVKQRDIENDRYGIYNPFFTALGEAARYDQDIRVLPLLLGGFSTSDYTGSNFFASGKIRTPGDKGFTNILVTGTGSQQANAPLSIYSYRAARANLMGRVNAAGRPMNLGRKLVLVCGAATEPIARQILVADTVIQANTSNDALAAVTNIDKGTATIVTSALIDASSTPNAWFLLETGLSLKPIAWQVNKNPVLTALTQPDSDHVFKKHEFLYQAYGRYNAGYLFSDLAFGSTGAGSTMTAYP
ncbi:MAG TPA: Mu-like prophage major head subunit gpT family protein [Candidatus Methylacidiphilales bacterium]|nr:Mu-like prophage major head subunit gpT family protein [Candidatus Methylacidiphilales bacterium]